MIGAETVYGMFSIGQSTDCLFPGAGRPAVGHQRQRRGGSLIESSLRVAVPRGGRAEDRHRGGRRSLRRSAHPPPPPVAMVAKGKDKGKAKAPPLTEEERLVQAEMEALKVRGGEGARASH